MADLNQILRDQRALRLIVKAAIVTGAFIAALLVIVYPIRSKISGYDKKVDAIREKLSEQHVMSPAFAKLVALKNRLPKEDLPVPRLVRIGRKSVFNVHGDIEKAAHASGMEPLDISVDTASVRGGKKEVLLNAVFGGKVDKLRSLYFELAKLPYLVRVTKIDIRPVQDEIEVLFALMIGVK